MSEEKPRVFLRDATGLVRRLSFFDAFVNNIASSGPLGVGVAYSIAWALSAQPGGDLVAMLAVVTPLSLFIVTTYALLSASIARSGGDYVWTSRTISPGWGFANTFNQYIAQCSWTAVLIWYVPNLLLAPALSIMGFISGDKTYANMAAWAAIPLNGFLIGTFFLIVLTLIAISGTTNLFRFQNITFVIATIGTILMVAVLLSSTHEGFVQTFNTYAAPFGTSYSQIIADAKGHGLSYTYPDWNASLTYLPIAFFWLSWCFSSSIFAGEVKRAGDVKRQLSSMYAATLFNGIFGVLIVGLIFAVVGYDFMASMTYLSFVTPGAYPFLTLPSAFLFLGMLSPNLPIAAAISLSLVFWAFPMFVVLVMILTRYPFAWSFDRIAPSQIAEINERFHSPVNSILIMSVAMWIVYALTTFTGVIWQWSAITAGAAANFYIMIVAVTGILFPYRKKGMYERSPAKRYEVGGIPILVVSGAVTVALIVSITYLYLTRPQLGLSNPWLGVGVWVGIYAVGFALYYISKALRKRQGIDLNLTFKEIPPE